MILVFIFLFGSIDKAMTKLLVVSLSWLIPSKISGFLINLIYSAALSDEKALELVKKSDKCPNSDSYLEDYFPIRAFGFYSFSSSSI